MKKQNLNEGLRDWVMGAGTTYRNIVRRALTQYVDGIINKKQCLDVIYRAQAELSPNTSIIKKAAPIVAQSMIGGGIASQLMNPFSAAALPFVYYSNAVHSPHGFREHTLFGGQDQNDLLKRLKTSKLPENEKREAENMIKQLMRSYPFKKILFGIGTFGVNDLMHLGGKLVKSDKISKRTEDAPADAWINKNLDKTIKKEQIKIIRKKLQKYLSE